MRDELYHNENSEADQMYQNGEPSADLYANQPDPEQQPEYSNVAPATDIESSLRSTRLNAKTNIVVRKNSAYARRSRPENLDYSREDQKSSGKFWLLLLGCVALFYFFSSSGHDKENKNDADAFDESGILTSSAFSVLVSTTSAEATFLATTNPPSTAISTDSTFPSTTSQPATFPAATTQPTTSSIPPTTTLPTTFTIPPTTTPYPTTQLATKKSQFIVDATWHNPKSKPTYQWKLFEKKVSWDKAYNLCASIQSRLVDVNRQNTQEDLLIYAMSINDEIKRERKKFNTFWIGKPFGHLPGNPVNCGYFEETKDCCSLMQIYSYPTYIAFGKSRKFKCQKELYFVCERPKPTH